MTSRQRGRGRVSSSSLVGHNRQSDVCGGTTKQQRNGVYSSDGFSIPRIARRRSNARTRPRCPTLSASSKSSSPLCGWRSWRPPNSMARSWSSHRGGEAASLILNISHRLAVPSSTVGPIVSLRPVRSLHVSFVHSSTSSRSRWPTPHCASSCPRANRHAPPPPPRPPLAVHASLSGMC